MPTKLPYLSEEHHFAIAGVATRSSQMEHMLEIAFAVIMSPNVALAEYLLKNLGQDRVVGAFGAALKDRLRAGEYDVDALISRIKHARSNRNDILHSIYGVSENADLAMLATLRPFRMEKRSEKSAQDFYDVADELLSICSELTRLLLVLDDRKPPLHTPVPPVPPASSPSPSILDPELLSQQHDHRHSSGETPVDE